MGFALADFSLGLVDLKLLAFKLGYLFQAQDDFLDCFGDPLITGKNSTDLMEGKCTWITCSIMEKISNTEEKEFFFIKNFWTP